MFSQYSAKLQRKIGLRKRLHVLNQKFNIEYQQGGYYKITAKHTGKSLTAKDGLIKENTEIVQSDYQGLDSQKWMLRDSKINGWVISSFINPGLSISVKGNIENGSRLILSETEYNNRQMYYMYNVIQEEKTKEDGIYKFAIGKNPNQVLQVSEEGIEENKQIDIHGYRKFIKSKILL